VAKVAHAHPGVDVTAAAPAIDGVDVLINASPVGMLADARLPIDVAALPRELVVPRRDREARAHAADRARRGGAAATVFGREMMHGQIAQMVDFFVAGQS
jgi:shikimate dehydrogenase